MDVTSFKDRYGDHQRRGEEGGAFLLRYSFVPPGFVEMSLLPPKIIED